MLFVGLLSQSTNLTAIEKLYQENPHDSYRHRVYFGKHKAAIQNVFLNLSVRLETFRQNIRAFEPMH